jgi:hypothetical protein
MVYTLPPFITSKTVARLGTGSPKPQIGSAEVCSNKARPVHVCAAQISMPMAQIGPIQFGFPKRRSIKIRVVKVDSR